VDALRVMPQTAPERVTAQANQVVAYSLRYEALGDPTDLEVALVHGEDALAASEPGSSVNTMVLAKLSADRRIRFGLFGDRNDLDWALTAARQAVERTSSGHPFGGSRLSNLATCLRTMFEATGDAQVLDDAIQLGREAAAIEIGGHATISSAATDVGSALLTRFELRGAAGDLNEAVRQSRRAVAVTPATSPYRASRLSNHSIVLRARVTTSGHHEDAEEAVQAARESVARAENTDPSRAGFCSNLGLALVARHELDRDRDGEDLDDAMEAFREAADLSGGRPEGGLYRSNLGMALRQRYSAAGADVDIEEAIALLTSTVAGWPSVHPNAAPYLLGLGNAYIARFESRADVDDLNAAISAWDKAADARGSAAAVRIAAAESVALATANQEDWRRSSEAYAKAMELLSAVAWHGLDRATKEKVLADLAMLSGSAAGVAIEEDNPSLAVEMLEAGRSVLWQQNLSGKDQISLLEPEHAELASKLRRKAALLGRFRGTS
jgi:tetratricopeptide (TPR) repeat protein